MSSSALAAGLRLLRGKMAVQCRNEESDEQLLYAFTARRDEDAFAVLVHRHGPMVLHVCRRVLGHEQDAEDAFQATFLMLARSAADLRKKTALAGFLHGAAYRIALTAKRSAARRRKHESQAPPPPASDPSEELSWREVRALLDEEIARLPDKYRSVFVLCCLENLSRAAAARRLGLKERTVLSRLAEARKRLQKRLVRRGVDLTAVLAATALATQTASAMPLMLLMKTMEAATRGAISASVAELMKGATAALIASKAKIATALLVTVSLLAGAGAWTYRTRAMLKPAEAQAESPASSSLPPHADKAQKPRQEKSEHVTVCGRVLDPDDKPVKGARLYLPLLKGEQLRPLATSDAAGRFSFQVMPVDVQLRPWLREPWRYAYLVAVSERYGPGVTAVGDPAESEELTLRLAKDDIPVKGRVLDLQGKPIASVTVRVDGIGVPKKGDLTAFLDDLKGRSDGYPAENNFLTRVYHADFARICPSATTGADGRFQIKGIGSERLAELTISGPTIETRQVRVRTRPGEKIQKLELASNPEGGRLVYYGTEFEHVAAPTKPIIGVVRDKKTGKPLANVTIQSYKLARNNISGRNFIRTVTDKDGRYRLTGMPTGDGNLIEAAPPEGLAYLNFIRPVEYTAGLDPVTVDFGLRRGVLVKGRVTDKKTGAAVESEVEYFIFRDNSLHGELLDSEFYSRYPTEADGSFHMVVPAGHGLVAARAMSDHYLVGVGSEKIELQGELRMLPTDPLCDPMAYHRLLEIDPAKDVQTLTCHLDVDPGRTLNGTVVGPDGKPLAGARICGLRSYLFTTWEHEPLRTAEFTAYALRPARPRNLLVIHEGKRVAGSLLVQGDEKGPVTVKLQPWGTIAGRLVTADGKPYTKGELVFGQGLRADDVTVGSHPLRSIPRDNKGRFRVEGLVPGLKYHFSLSGFLGKELTIKAGETKDLGDVTIKPIE